MNFSRGIHRRTLHRAVHANLLNTRFFSGTTPTFACHSSPKKRPEVAPGSCRKDDSSISVATSSSMRPARAMLEASFWSCRATWRRSSLNTLRCLIGCTVGDFSALWTLQSYYPELGMNTIMLASMASGITASVILETVLLRRGPDNMSWKKAAQTAMGMSMVSMVAMEVAENAVDYHLTGGLVAFDNPQFWGAAMLAVGAGFLAPLPYNYARLRKYGKACH